MPFWNKQHNKSKKVYYPQAIVKGKPVETEDIANLPTTVISLSGFIKQPYDAE